MSAGRKLLRQGDVLLVPVERAPRSAVPVPRERGRLVLAHGEATGHAHVVVGEAELLNGGGQFLVVGGGAPSSLVHDEHAPIAIEVGVYEVRRQREYVPPVSSAPSRRSWQWVRD